jgi:hypothetical protein
MRRSSFRGGRRAPVDDERRRGRRRGHWRVAKSATIAWALRPSARLHLILGSSPVDSVQAYGQERSNRPRDAYIIFSHGKKDKGPSEM